MSSGAAVLRRCHAFLLGLGAPIASGSAGRSRFEALPGSSADVEAWTTFLTDRFGRSLELRSWTTPATDGDGDVAPLPTLSNLRAAFAELATQARAGDQVLVLFVGHGVRLPTLERGPEGGKGWDEALVLAPDPDKPGDSWDDFVMRDTETFAWSRRWAEAGLLVTWLADACHSGGASKEAPPILEVPGVAWGCEEPRPRSLALRHAWLPSLPRGVVFLASCQPHQLAHQLWVPELGTYRGCLSHGLLELLQAPGSETWTWQRLHRRLVPWVHQRVPHQSPRLEGEITRQVLSWDRGSAAPGPRPRLDPCPAPLRWLAVGLPSGLEVEVTRRVVDGSVLQRVSGAPWDLALKFAGGQLSLDTPAEILIPPNELEPTASSAARALVHRARFETVRRLANPSSALEGQVQVRLRPLAGKSFRLDLDNVGPRVLYLALLHLRSDGAIEQVYPTEGSSVPLEPEGSEAIRGDIDETDMPRDREEELMVFATTLEIDFRGFEQPPWCGGSSPRPGDDPAFEKLLDLLARRRSRSGVGGWDWTVLKRLIPLALLLVTWIAPTWAWADPPEALPESACDQIPFQEGEMARFVVRFGFLKAGDAIGCLARVRPPEPEVELAATPREHAWQLVGRGRSSKLVSVFYQLDDRLAVWMDPVSLIPLRQELVVRESHERSTRRVLFDHGAGRTHFYRDRTYRRGRDPSLRDRWDDLVPGAFDPVSLFFHLRCREGGPGDVLRIPLHENGKNREVEVRVEGVESLDTVFGTIEAISAQVHLYFEGKLSNKQAFRVWVSNDRRRVPLRFVADFTFAKLVGELAGYRPHHDAESVGDLVGPIFEDLLHEQELDPRNGALPDGRALWDALCPDAGFGLLDREGKELPRRDLEASGERQPAVP